MLHHLNKSEFPFAMSVAAPELRICTLDKQLLQNNAFPTCLMVGILMFFLKFAFTLVCERTQHYVFTDLLPFFAIPFLTVVYISPQTATLQTDVLTFIFRLQSLHHWRKVQRDKSDTEQFQNLLTFRNKIYMSVTESFSNKWQWFFVPLN